MATGTRLCVMLADAQFIGFRHAKFNRNDIIGLIQGMALTKIEWKKWKAHPHSSHSSLSKDEIREVDEYFNI